MSVRRARGAVVAGALLGDRTGAAAIEFAIVGGMVMLLTVGLLDLARAGYAAHVLQEAVDEAARYAVVRSGTSGQAVTADAIAAKAQAGAATLGGTPPAVTVTFLPDGTSKPGNQVRVAATYTFRFAAAFLPSATLNLSAQTQLTILN